ncbi:MAG: winged helix-turn-helix domain-containing protein [Candidatus Omnitrophota bacterium]
MITRIGIIAGEIWHYLDQHGPSRLSDMLSKIDTSRDTMLMSLGWLAREGHVILDGEKDYVVTLRKQA